MTVSLRAYTVNLAGDRWRFLVTARDGALKADVPDYEIAERFLVRWSELAEDEPDATPVGKEVEP